jgi:hypothetical protein
LEELALEAHENCMNKKHEAWERLRWARIEAYVYQVIKTAMKTYDNVVIEQKIDELTSWLKMNYRKRRVNRLEERE